MLSLPLHPQLVHFPIAFLILAGGLYLASLWKRELLLGAFVTHVAGVVATIAAILTGDAEEHNASHFNYLLEWHERLGMATAWVFGLLAIWSFLRRTKATTIEKALFMGLYLAALGMMAYGAHLGGTMVYELGVGTAVQPAIPGSH